MCNPNSNVILKTTRHGKQASPRLPSQYSVRYYPLKSSNKLLFINLFTIIRALRKVMIEGTELCSQTRNRFQNVQLVSLFNSKLFDDNNENLFKINRY